MANEKENPSAVLGEKIIQMGRQEQCELIIALCEQIQDEVGTDHYRGGVFPGNIRATEDGPALGPAAASGWQGEELAFLAPELYWKGERTPAGDVYSLGLLLYYAMDNGRLPFSRDGEEAAAQRRLNGEAFPAPRCAGRRLGEIITKATAFRAAERYQTVAELKAVLQSCAKMYLSGAPSAEALFQKDEAELSQVERMMVSILRRDADHSADAEEKERTNEDETVKENEEEKLETPKAEEPMEEAVTEEAAEAPAEETAAAEESVTGEEPEPEPEPEEDVKIAAPAQEKGREPIPILEVEHNPELEPVILDWPAEEIRYGANVERERKIAETVKKRRRRPILAVVLLCVLLLGVAAISKAINDRNRVEPAPVSGAEPTPPVAEGPEAPTPAGAAAPEELDAPEETAPVETPTPESTYQIYLEDVSWTEARDRCVEQGGHLVVINDKDEFDKVVALAETFGVDMVWIGCRRTEGELRWVTDEEVAFWPWGEGEPSYVDSYDDMGEDYLMLWDVVGDWGYNDSRNDPIAYYPAAYTGRIAYVCEFES